MAADSEQRDLVVSYREHVSTRDELKAKIQDLELRYERLSATLLHLPDKVDALTKSVQDLATAMLRQAAVKKDEPDHTSLAIHRALDEMNKRSGGSIERWILLALVGGAGWMAARFFIGG